MNSIHELRIAAVIVTYNRKNLLVKNLNMLLKQSKKLDMIIIIDNNSTDGTGELLKDDYLSLSTVHYLRLPENIGGAGGFSKGIEIAHSMGFDYIWLMDDDGRPYDDDTFMNIITKAFEIRKVNNLIFLNSLVLNDQRELTFELPKIKSITEIKQYTVNGLFTYGANPFNGTLISKELVDKIGYPNKDFFIKGDENDYQDRAIRNGAFLATVVESIYYHPSISKAKYKFMGKNKETDAEAPWKEYYKTRNYTYMYKKNKQPKRIFQLIIARIHAIVFVKGKRFKRFYFVSKGLFDGLFGRLGKRVNP